MNRTFVVLFLLLFAPFLTHGQDTLKIMSWNLLNYNITSAQSRNQYYRTVIRHVNPDILVVQEMHLQAGVDSFYNKVVNAVFPGGYVKGDFVPGLPPSDSDNGIFYRPTKFTFISNSPIRTALRDISEFKLYNVTAADTLRIYSLHLKASTGFETDRGAEIDSLRKVTNSLPNGKYFIVVGDYNIYTSTEPAYTKLTQDNPTDDGHFLDAVSITGTWNNGSYSPYHTQSTRTRALGDGGATGGLDDRFDMILYSRAMSLPGKIRYLPGSLTPIGNDGNHYNDSINKMPNAAVSDSVANALYFSSDHLPVSIKVVFTPSTVTSQYNVTTGWNIISVPLDVIDYRKTSVYPSSSTSAYAFDQSAGYIIKDTLKNGLGYWLKFPSTQAVSITGSYRAHDTVNVSAGWNLIGSSSGPVAVTAIQQIPPSILASSFFLYSNGYAVADSLRPDNGYWVKVTQNGRLVLK